MKVLKITLAIPFMFLLAMFSMPFIAIALGYCMIGDEEGSDRWFERTPLTMWFGFVQGKNDTE